MAKGIAKSMPWGKIETKEVKKRLTLAQIGVVVVLYLVQTSLFVNMGKALEMSWVSQIKKRKDNEQENSGRK